MNDMLSWLLAGHMAGDYLFQTRWMAERKTTHFSALAIHAAVYTCAVYLASLARGQSSGGLSSLGVLFVFAAHVVIDKRNITLWWCRHVTRSNRTWLLIMTDQSLHVVILALTCILERRW